MLCLFDSISDVPLDRALEQGGGGGAHLLNSGRAVLRDKNRRSEIKTQEEAGFAISTTTIRS